MNQLLVNIYSPPQYPLIIRASIDPVRTPSSEQLKFAHHTPISDYMIKRNLFFPKKENIPHENDRSQPRRQQWMF
jgi:hypothetical protein